MARLLYPHDDLEDRIYLEALDPLLRAERAGSLASQLRAGIEMLDSEAGGNWLAASLDDQVAALGSLEGRAFFATMQTVVRRNLYRHHEVWRLIGYEGSSVEYGGYLHRGFDDIDWLPRD